MSNKVGNYIYGIRSAIEAIRAGKEIDKIFIRQGAKSELAIELFSLIRKEKIPYQFVPVQRLNRITQKNHQGVITFLSIISYYTVEQILPGIYESGENPFVLVLDQISDVRNFGAIIRTAECAGVHAVVIPKKGSAQINPDAVKTSAGALHTMPVCRNEELTEAVKFLKDSGLHIVAATEKTKNIYHNARFDAPLAIILGSEEKGISEKILELADEKIKIPLKGKIESLNVSVTAGILIYEAVKQRNNTGIK
jgi:23S rRNA (guanosine2251-2'-O)-methyltransferase